MKYQETAKRLKYALEKNGISQQELSEKSGVSKSSISQYINGTHAPSNISSGKIAKVLNVSPIWLMGFNTLENESLKKLENTQLKKDYPIPPDINLSYDDIILELIKKMDDIEKRALIIQILSNKTDERSRDMMRRILNYYFT